MAAITTKTKTNNWKFSHEEDPGPLRETRWIYKCACGEQKTHSKSVDVGFGSSMAKADYETKHCETVLLPTKDELFLQLLGQGKSADEIKQLLALYQAAP
jgi:hypothetical protein